MAFPFVDELQLSDSSRSGFWSCPRKLEFRKFYRSSRRDDSFAAGLGRAFHECLQEWELSGDIDKAYTKLLLHHPIKFDKGPMNTSSIEASYAAMEELLANPQLQEYELVWFNIDGEEKPGIEVPFKIILDDFSLSDEKHIPVSYLGRVDLILRSKTTGEYLVCDIKSTGRWVDDASVLYQFDEQLIPYDIVLRQILGNKELESFSILYLQSYLHPLEPKSRFYTFMKSEADVQDWLRSFLVDVQQIKMFYQMGWFPRRGKNCQAFNRTCVFFDMCGYRDAETLELMLGMENAKAPASYIQEPWVTIHLSYKDSGI